MTAILSDADQSATVETAPVAVNTAEQRSSMQLDRPCWATDTEQFETGEVIHSRTASIETTATANNHAEGDHVLEVTLDSWDVAKADGTVRRDDPQISIYDTKTHDMPFTLSMGQAQNLRDAISELIAAAANGAGSGENVIDTKAEQRGPLSPSEMLALADAQPEPTHPLFQTFAAELEGGVAHRHSYAVTWKSDDECRDVSLCRTVTVTPDGTISHCQELIVMWPELHEVEGFMTSLVKLFRLGFELGKAEGSPRA